MLMAAAKEIRGERVRKSPKGTITKGGLSRAQLCPPILTGGNPIYRLFTDVRVPLL